MQPIKTKQIEEKINKKEIQLPEVHKQFEIFYACYQVSFTFVEHVF